MDYILILGIIALCIYLVIRYYIYRQSEIRWLARKNRSELKKRLFLVYMNKNKMKYK